MSFIRSNLLLVRQLMAVLEAFGEADVIAFVVCLVKARLVRRASSAVSGPCSARPASPKTALKRAFAGTKLAPALAFAFSRSDPASANGFDRLLAAFAGRGFPSSAAAGGTRFPLQSGTPPVAWLLASDRFG